MNLADNTARSGALTRMFAHANGGIFERDQSYDTCNLSDHFVAFVDFRTIRPLLHSAGVRIGMPELLVR